MHLTMPHMLEEYSSLPVGMNLKLDCLDIFNALDSFLKCWKKLRRVISPLCASEAPHAVRFF